MSELNNNELNFENDLSLKPREKQLMHHFLESIKADILPEIDYLKRKISILEQASYFKPIDQEFKVDSDLK